MWRPDNWAEEYLLAYKEEHSGEGRYEWATPERAMFEAGADAMLEALKKKGEYRDNKAIISSSKNGWVVFIPEE